MKLPLIVIVLMVLVVLGTIFSIYMNAQVYDFGAFKIKQSQLNALADQAGDNFVVCSIKDNACAKIGKLNG